MKKLALIGVVLIFFGAVGLLLNSGSGFLNSENVTIDEVKTIGSEGVETIEIKVDIGKVNITESNTDEIVVHYRGNVPTEQFKFVAERNGNHANIAAHSKRSFFSVPFINTNWNTKRNLEIALPKKRLTKVVVHGDVAKIDIGTKNVAELIVNSDVGEISIEKFHGERMELRTDAGTVSVAEASGELDVQTDTGNIDLVMSEITKDIRLKSDVGAIHVVMKQVPESLVLDVDSEVGNVSVTRLAGFEQLTGKPLRAHKGEGGPLLDVKTDVGSITIEQRD
ncbi:DUF4097 family beta strand repeat-containing protein [Pueribacillus sp. YX66]|uniref:DUF4097 family beta strand repeat-containing protein n=1 Tax=Pueribacillus sp. YX66 TaxID=3229242 RepID=UPI00358D2363